MDERRSGGQELKPEQQEHLPDVIELPRDELELYFDYIEGVDPLWNTLETLSRLGELPPMLQDVWERAEAFVDSLAPPDAYEPDVDGRPQATAGAGDDPSASTVVEGHALAAETARAQKCKYWRCALSNGYCYTLNTNYPTAVSRCRKKANATNTTFKRPLRCGRC